MENPKIENATQSKLHIIMQMHIKMFLIFILLFIIWFMSTVMALWNSDLQFHVHTGNVLLYHKYVVWSVLCCLTIELIFDCQISN